MGHNAIGHKKTIACPLKGCKYTSRLWVHSLNNSVSMRQSTWSTKCPLHREVLIDIYTKKGV